MLQHASEAQLRNIKIRRGILLGVPDWIDWPFPSRQGSKNPSAVFNPCFTMNGDFPVNLMVFQSHTLHKSKKTLMLKKDSLILWSCHSQMTFLLSHREKAITFEDVGSPGLSLEVLSLWALHLPIQCSSHSFQAQPPIPELLMPLYTSVLEEKKISGDGWIHGYIINIWGIASFSCIKHEIWALGNDSEFNSCPLWHCSSVCKKPEVPRPCNLEQHKVSGAVWASLETNWIMPSSSSSQSVMGMQRLGLFFLLSFFVQSL